MKVFREHEVGASSIVVGVLNCWKMFYRLLLLSRIEAAVVVIVFADGCCCWWGVLYNVEFWLLILSLIDVILVVVHVVVRDLFPKQDGVGRGRWRVLKRSRCWQELSGLSKWKIIWWWWRTEQCTRSLSQMVFLGMSLQGSGSWIDCGPDRWKDWKLLPAAEIKFLPAAEIWGGRGGGCYSLAGMALELK